jgi:hypothetical protein
MTMGFGAILPIAAIIATAILVLMTAAHNTAKVGAVALCIGSFLLPRLFPSFWIAAPLIQLVLSVVIILYLKFHHYVD